MDCRSRQHSTAMPLMSVRTAQFCSTIDDVVAYQQV